VWTNSSTNCSAGVFSDVGSCAGVLLSCLTATCVCAIARAFSACDYVSAERLVCVAQATYILPHSIPPSKPSLSDNSKGTLPNGMSQFQPGLVDEELIHQRIGAREQGRV